VNPLAIQNSSQLAVCTMDNNGNISGGDHGVLTTASGYTHKNTADIKTKKETECVLEEGHRLPEIKTLQNAAKLSIVEDRPIMMDYWTSSLEKTVMIGVRNDEKKMLIKNEEEYTSYIEKIFRINGKDFIILTENSIYIVDKDIPTKKISFNTDTE
jgi:hypothetical protein